MKDIFRMQRTDLESGQGCEHRGRGTNAVELVTPILSYGDLDILGYCKKVGSRRSYS